MENNSVNAITRTMELTVSIHGLNLSTRAKARISFHDDSMDSNGPDRRQLHSQNVRQGAILRQH
jgi:hypothetical protein